MNRRIRTWLASAALSFCGLTAAGAATPQGPASGLHKLYDPNGGVFVVAHRGCHNPAPSRRLFEGAAENSLEALDRCVSMGVDMVETDVRKTKDGVLVIMHDATVDRTTNGKGVLADMTLAQVKALRLRRNFGGTAAPQLTSEAPPTLDEYLARAKGRILINLDIKDPIDREVVNATRAAGMLDQVVIKAVATDAGAALADLEPYRDVTFMPVVKPADEDSPRLDLGAIVAAQAVATRPIPAVEMVFLGSGDFVAVRAAARKARIRLWTNTLTSVGVLGLVDVGGDVDALRDGGKTWGKLIAMGVSIIQTDEPGALLDYLARRPSVGHHNDGPPR